MSQLLTAEIGQRIARYRKLNGWSAQRLADNTDGALTRATIANIETGRRIDLTLRQFLTICLALRVPPVALLVDLEKPFEPAPVRFPGSAPAPLDPTAPNAVLARWLNGQRFVATTRAAARVEQLTDLTGEYLAVADEHAITEARDRLSPHASQDAVGVPGTRLRAARHQLEEAGVDAAAV